jgi:hypothetical protein
MRAGKRRMTKDRSNRPTRRRLFAGFFFAASILTGHIDSRADEVAEPPLQASVGQAASLPRPPNPAPKLAASATIPVPGSAAEPLGDVRSLSSFIEEIVREALPAEYEDRDDWGRKVRLLSKRVNHGLWKRYRVKLLNPEHRFRLELRNVRAHAGGMACEVAVTARARVVARAESWNYGVKAWSTDASTDVTVKIVADCELRWRTEERASEWLADLVLEPHVRDVRLRLTDVDVRRVGLLRGDAAEALGNGSRRFVEQLLERQEPRVLKKVRREAEELQDRLRIPVPKLSAVREANLHSGF